MKPQCLVLLACLITCHVQVAHAVSDPCYLARNQALAAERQVTTAQRLLGNAQNQLSNAQSQAEIRLDGYRMQIAQAQANVQVAGAVSGGQAASCAIRSIFGRIGAGCFAGAAASSYVRQARARTYYNLSVSRYNSYVQYLNGYLRRLAQRIVDTQTQYNQANEAYQQAAAAYQQCTQANASKA